MAKTVRLAKGVLRGVMLGQVPELVESVGATRCQWIVAHMVMGARGKSVDRGR